MRRRTSQRISSIIYLLCCLTLLTIGLSVSTAIAQTSDELLYKQIQASVEQTSAEVGSNDLQASVIIVAGDSIFIDAGKVAGVEKSNYQGGQLVRRTSGGEKLVGNFAIMEIGGEVSQIVVITAHGESVQMGDRAVFSNFSPQAGIPNSQSIQQVTSHNSLKGLFADTDPNAGRSIGLASRGLANGGLANSASTAEAATNNTTDNGSQLMSTRAYNTEEVQVTKSSVVPAGSAASFVAGFVNNAIAQNAATGAPLYCSDARFADREACQAPVPLMANSTVNPVNVYAENAPVVTNANTNSVNVYAENAPVVTRASVNANSAVVYPENAPIVTNTSSNVPAYCSSQAYMSRPECLTNASVAPQQQSVRHQHVSQTAPAASSASLPGYCIDSRFATRPECFATPATTSSATVASSVPSSVPGYCSTPANQSRPECLAGHNTSVANHASHVSTATAMPHVSSAATGTALSIDPYTGKPYTTSYQGYRADEATPLVHTAAHSQATQTQASHAQTSQAHLTRNTNRPSRQALTGVVSDTPYGTSNASAVGLANSTEVTSVDIPAHIGPATIANQTIAAPSARTSNTASAATSSATTASRSYTTAQTYYDTNWGDSWDPTYVNTTPNASGIVPAGSPAPYFLRVARVKNNLGFPNEAIEILEMGLLQYPNDVALNSEITMIYRMLSAGGSFDDWCPEEGSYIEAEPIATVDECAEDVEEEYAYDDYNDHEHDEHNHEHDDHMHDDDHDHDDNHDHEHEDHGHEHDDHDHEHSHDSNDHYANDQHENVQLTTRYNAPLRNDAPLSNTSQNYNQQPNQERSQERSQEVARSNNSMINQSYAAQNKPAFNSPIGMENNSFYSDEKGGVVRPLWNTGK